MNGIIYANNLKINFSLLITTTSSRLKTPKQVQRETTEEKKKKLYFSKFNGIFSLEIWTWNPQILSFTEPWTLCSSIKCPLFCGYMAKTTIRLIWPLFLQATQNMIFLKKKVQSSN